jgi:hypothetical protein
MSISFRHEYRGGIRICRIARIQAMRFLIRAIRELRIQKAFSCLILARQDWDFQCQIHCLFYLPLRFCRLALRQRRSAIRLGKIM